MTNLTIANTILEQLGGNKFVAMTGAYNFIPLESGLRMNLRKNSSVANRLEITLEPWDTYTMKFYRYSVHRLTMEESVKITAEYEDVYFDQLQEFFTQATGMYTSLGTLGR